MEHIFKYNIRTESKRFFVMLFLCFFVTLSPCHLGTVAAAAGKFVLVIDAGHGGKDAGCVGKTMKEKTLTLKYALAFGAIVERNCPDVKVVYTRTTDRFLELWQRAEVANKHKADLFVSVHINAVPKSHTVQGYQTYTLGRGETTGKKGIQENLEVAKRENAVIFMEKDYKQRYQGFNPNSPESNIMFEFIQDANMERSVALAKFLQNSICSATGRVDKGAHQNNLAVLRLTSMPACLMELGFISCPDEETFLSAPSSVEKYSRGFLKAFISYKNKYFDGLNVPYRPSDIKETQVPAEEPQAEAAKKRSQPAQKKDEALVVQPSEKTQEKTPSADTVKQEEKPAVKQEEKPAIKQEEKPVVKQEDVPDAPVFKIQISLGRKKLPANDRQFKGLKDVDFYEEGGFYKYTVGSSTDYNAIARLRKEILDKFPEAFIIAFKAGQKMNVNEAIAEFKKNKGK